MFNSGYAKIYSKYAYQCAWSRQMGLNEKNIEINRFTQIELEVEKEILSIFKKYSINCQIIRSTIIYGVYKDLDDRNFIKIINLFKNFPFCIIPSQTGYRQPIHFSQLSELTYFLLEKLNKNISKDTINQILEVGGERVSRRMKPALEIVLRNQQIAVHRLTLLLGANANALIV